MKRFIAYGLVLIMGMVFLVSGCNTPDDGTKGDDRPGEDLDIPFDTADNAKGQLFEINGTGSYPGLEITLPKDVVDISKYSHVIIEATLYSDKAGTSVSVEPTGPDADTNLAQCKLLKVSGGSNWATESNNVCAGDYTKDHMTIDGATTINIPSGSSGVPTILLVQANWAANNGAVQSIRVRKISFFAKKYDFTLDHVFGNSVTASGDTITFTNASYSDDASGNNWDGTTGIGGAAILIFPESWNATSTESLQNKTIKINFTIPQHTCTSATGVTEVEHQIHVQAANAQEQEKFNGQNPPDHANVGQLYITLDSTGETGYDDGTGTITISSTNVNMLINASKVSGTGNDYAGPFTFNAVRLVNNGTKWDDTNGSTSKIHYRCKSYKVVINSVELQ